MILSVYRVYTDSLSQEQKMTLQKNLESVSFMLHEDVNSFLVTVRNDEVFPPSHFSLMDCPYKDVTNLQ